MGVFGTYKLLRLFLSINASLAGALAFLVSPFLFSSIFVRGSIGEVLAYAIFPLAVFATELALRDFTKKRAATMFISVLVLMLAHNILSMLFLGILLLFVICRVMKEGFLKSRMIIATLLLSILSSMFFWIPAIFEKKFVSLDATDSFQVFTSHFPTLSQLLFSPYSFGFSYPGPVDSLQFQVGLVFILSLFLSVPLILGKSKNYKSILLFFVCFLLVFFAMLQHTEVLWKIVPVLSYIQFPWRLISIVSILGSILVAFVFEDLTGRPRRSVTFLLLFLAIGTLNKQVSSYIHHEDEYYKLYNGTSSTQHENMPKTLTKQPDGLSSRTPSVKNGFVHTVSLWTGSQHRYSVELTEPGLVVEPTAFFPGWETKSNGKNIEITPEKADGFIAFSLPAGKHEVRSVFTQKTPARIVGNAVSLASVLIFAALFFRLPWNRNKQHE